MKKLTLIDRMTGIEYEFPNWLRKARVGRDQRENELVIPDRGYRDSLAKEQKDIFDQIAREVSRATHFILYQEDGEKKIGFYETSNSIKINGQEMVYGIKIPLNDKDNILLGKNYRLKIRIEDKDTNKLKGGFE